MSEKVTNGPAWAQPLGRVPSGIFILTIRQGEQETGMLASWVMQAGFDPPAVSVAVKHGRYVEDWLAAGVPFVLNLVPESDKTLLKHFGKGFTPDEPAFEGQAISRTESGVPVLLTAMGHLECTPQTHVDAGDHRLFVAHVQGGSLSQDVTPMVHIRKNGLNY